MIVYYSGGDSGFRQNPEALLMERARRPANIMLSYHHCTPDGQNKYVSRWRRILQSRGYRAERSKK